MQNQEQISNYYLELELLKNQLSIVNKTLLWKLKFGKFKDKTYIDIINNNESYIEWMINNNMLNEKVLKAYNLIKKIKSIENSIYHLNQDYD